MAKFNLHYHIKKMKKIIFNSIILLLFVYNNQVSSQIYTSNNTDGFWSDDNIWSNGVSPGTDNISQKITINGNIICKNNISFKKGGKLEVNDTLTIHGDLLIHNKNDLIINENGILIILGTFDSKNKTNIENNGYFIVIGDFKAVGSKSSITSPGNAKIYITGSVHISPRHNYPLLDCDPADFPANCGYGDLSSLQLDPIYSFVQSGGYRIKATGLVEFCDGLSVTLICDYQGFSFQWYKDNQLIDNQTNNDLNVSESGSYHVT